MRHQLVFIHGGETFPDYAHYIDWLQSESTFDPERNDRRSRRWHRQLESALPGWEILRPQMPNDLNAQYLEWSIYFKKVIPHIREGAVLVGHSLGGTFLLKYLSQERMPISLTSIHLVAPSFGVEHTSFTVSEDISFIARDAKYCTVHHATDDRVVPYAESETGVSRISGAQLLTYEHRGHFLDETFPELIDLVEREVG